MYVRRDDELWGSVSASGVSTVHIYESLFSQYLKLVNTI